MHYGDLFRISASGIWIGTSVSPCDAGSQTHHVSKFQEKARLIHRPTWIWPTEQLYRPSLRKLLAEVEVGQGPLSTDCQHRICTQVKLF